MTAAERERRIALELLHDPRNAAWGEAEHERRFPDSLAPAAAEHRIAVRAAMGPASWELIDASGNGEKWRHRGERLLAIWSLSLEADERPWLHVSVSHASRIPWHEDMAKVKAIFVGDRYAYSVWPPADRYVNLKDVLHLWAPWWPEDEGMPLPEFSRVSATGVRTI